MSCEMMNLSPRPPAGPSFSGGRRQEVVKKTKPSAPPSSAFLRGGAASSLDVDRKQSQSVLHAVLSSSGWGPEEGGVGGAESRPPRRMGPARDVGPRGSVLFLPGQRSFGGRFCSQTRFRWLRGRWRADRWIPPRGRERGRSLDWFRAVNSLVTHLKSLL